LSAEHTAPSGINPRLDNAEGVFRALQISFGDVNAVDRTGFWRMADFTIEAEFSGKILDEIARDEEQAFFLHADVTCWAIRRRNN
jgi:hypothetical protein